MTYYTLCACKLCTVSFSHIDFNFTKVYDLIATEFSSTRHSAWPAVLDFLREQPAGAFGADLGCGNGKYLVAAAQPTVKQSEAIADESLPASSSQKQELTAPCQSKRDIHQFCLPLAPMLALDRSTRLTHIVRERGFDVVVGDILRLPYLANRLDFFLCIAVIHHLSTMERRLQAVVELARLLRPNGRGLIQVWAKEQHDPRSDQPTRYLRKQRSSGEQSNVCTGPDLIFQEPVLNARLPVHISGTEFPATDMLVPWKQKQRKVKRSSPVDDQLVDKHRSDEGSCQSEAPGRYYHLFVQGELDALVRRVSSLRTERSFYEQGNWAVIVVKVDEHTEV
ncbi:Alkylated DNA repair protein alkB 8 [Paragonimus heterotremus]|uniref:Alkylated DNA repair protein alkB 8 n=1 Tax=Paragonimus heterotremus TaxID=100268 RepID=A0A8J4WIY5_9TREM|nr:Alkylated DNA repair protein alkB 8 [Paragonimus heterotremus]